MITKFTTVYAGHVDLPDRGQNATPAHERRHSNEHLASVFDKTEAIAKKMDELGFEILWLAEHHFQHEGYECIPNDLMLAVHLAHVTKNLKIGCAFNIAPMWHPPRLAEDFATTDILTKGRTIFGVGRGYHTREVETFGAPMLDQEANRELFEEQVEAVSRRGSWAAAGVPTVEHYMDLGSWFAGTPGQLVDRLKGFEERYPGMQHISLSSPIGTPESIMLEQFQWLGEEVMPAFSTGRR